MMKPTKANVRKEAGKVGATVDEFGDRFKSIGVWLPKGKVWKANGGHLLSAGSYHKLDSSAFEDLLDRMAYGVEDLDDCGDPSCEICNPE